MIDFLAFMFWGDFALVGWGLVVYLALELWLGRGLYD